jgi:hypothetical protein
MKPLRAIFQRRYFPQHILLPLVPLVFASIALADDDESAILIDGISVITGSQTSNESDATPVLLSDVEFEAMLIRAASLGPGAVLERIASEEWQRAQRQAVLMRLLAAQARYLHEQASEEEKSAIRAETIAMVGGETAMDRLLARLGLGFQELDLFSETAALALTQIRYFEEQVELPKPRKGPRRRPRFDKEDPISKRYRRLVLQEQAEEQIIKWISDLIENGHIRMVR